MDIYPPVTLEKYPFLKENKYFEYDINLTPSQIKDFGKNNIVTLDFTSNKVPFKVFLTNAQIKKLEVAKKFQRKVDLKFSKTQFKKTLPYVTSLNRHLIRQWGKDKLEILKAENIEKAKTLKKLKAQQDEISFDDFIKNTMKKYNKPKPKKKRTFNNNLGNLFTKNFI